MALLARFIGIDKYVDPHVTELTGAARDARALDALFRDSVPGINAGLLNDEGATLEAVRSALAETLGAAGPDDVVVLSFAGHGTSDHRLVLHDSSRERGEETTLAMAELARQFRESRARAVLCILDCCFSGEAPARVLDGGPVARDEGLPTAEMLGRGRALLAASAANESAYEHPETRHGLLTSALIEALTSAEAADAGSDLGLGAVMDDVISRVRAGAAAMHRTQTPVLLNMTEGGLTLPRLRRGDHFARAFPELSRVAVSADVSELAVFGLPPEVLAEWRGRLPAGLNALQLEAVNEQRVLDGASVLVVAPTSAGKTFVGEMAAVRAIAEGRKAVFLLPYKALVNEKFDDFTAFYGGRIGMRVVRCTGDYADQVQAFLRGKYEIALLTYETFLALSVGSPATLNRLGLVVLDEAQFIADKTRGAAVELLLTNLVAARERGVRPQLVVLSATIGDVNHFDEWLGVRPLVRRDRPVPLEEGVLDRGGTYQYLDPDGREHTTRLLPAHAILQRGKDTSAQDVIVPLARQLLASPSEKLIVFRNERGSAQGCAKYLARDAGLAPGAEALARLPRRDATSASADLRVALAGGTAFHNSNLNRDERAVVEQAFRDPAGPVRILVATTTVAAGINTPASTVLLVEHEFYSDEGPQPFTVAEYKNMAGRAGRLGYQETGRAILLADTPREREQLFRTYVRGTPEPMSSSFKEGALGTWVLRLLAQTRRAHVTQDDVVHLLANTFGGYLRGRAQPGWRGQTERQLATLLPRMVAAGLVEEVPGAAGALQLTPLGAACGRSALSFESSLQLVEMLRLIAATGAQVPCDTLLALVQALPEMDARYTPMFKKGTSETGWPRDAATRFGAAAVQAMQRGAGPDPMRYYARCKRAAITGAWIDGAPLEGMEQRFTATKSWFGRVAAGDVRGIADLTRLVLGSATQIAALVLLDRAPTPQEIETLLRRLEVGLPEAALPLLDFPVPLARGEYLALLAAGVRTPEDVWRLAQERVAELLDPRSAGEVARRRHLRAASVPGLARPDASAAAPAAADA